MRRFKKGDRFTIDKSLRKKIINGKLAYGDCYKAFRVGKGFEIIKIVAGYEPDAYSVRLYNEYSDESNGTYSLKYKIDRCFNDLGISKIL